MNVLVTGVAGFIGFHLARRLAAEGGAVVGIDNINNYYDVALKHGRLRELGFEHWDEGEAVSTRYARLKFRKLDIVDSAAVKGLFEKEHFDVVVHLAAQAGVRYSLENPKTYVDSNVYGFLSILEAARSCPVKHVVYASSSSVYGLNTAQPFSETQQCCQPASLYAATKCANELMAHTYAHLYHIPLTGLRFFTVYGPWGRPDMAIFLFTKAMLAGDAITVFNNGDMQRDFTYIDDIVEGITRVIPRAPNAVVSARVYNIGHGAPVPLMDMVRALENALGVTAKINCAPMQSGDVPVTWADCAALERDTGYRPTTTIDIGIGAFVDWYRDFYRN
jgi:UDP-glucuronate 4-epimerase